VDGSTVSGNGTDEERRLIVYIYHIDEKPNSLDSRFAADLRWTTNPPTEPGLYRAKRWDGGFVNWVEVGEFTHGYPFVLMYGSDVTLGLDEFTHWLGPLPVPEPPTEGETDWSAISDRTFAEIQGEDDEEPPTEGKP
jgi:hypothetical protein